MSARLANIVLGTISIAFGGYIYSTAMAFRNQAAAQMPYLVAVTMILLGLILVVANVRPATVDAADVVKPFAGVPWPMWFLSVFMSIALAVSMTRIGFYESAFFFLTIMTAVLFGTTQGWQTGLKKGVVFGVAYTVVLWLLMDVVLNLRTPRGLFIG